MLPLKSAPEDLVGDPNSEGFYGYYSICYYWPLAPPNKPEGAAWTGWLKKDLAGDF